MASPAISILPAIAATPDTIDPVLEIKTIAIDTIGDLSLKEMNTLIQMSGRAMRGLGQFEAQTQYLGGMQNSSNNSSQLADAASQQGYGISNRVLWNDGWLNDNRNTETTITTDLWANQNFAYSLSSNSQSITMSWVTWNQEYDATLSGAEVYARREQIYEQRLAKEIERTRKLAEATSRAEKLLLDNLTPEQASQFVKFRTFEVLSADGKRRYRVGYGIAGNILLLNERGAAVEKYCIHPDVKCPTEDVMLAQKLMIEMDEKSFLRIANRTRLAA